jgi:hypothetical protein
MGVLEEKAIGFPKKPWSEPFFRVVCSQQGCYISAEKSLSVNAPYERVRGLAL